MSQSSSHLHYQSQPPVPFLHGFEADGPAPTVTDDVNEEELLLDLGLENGASGTDKGLEKPDRVGATVGSVAARAVSPSSSQVSRQLRSHLKFRKFLSRKSLRLDPAVVLQQAKAFIPDSHTAQQAAQQAAQLMVPRLPQRPAPARSGRRGWLDGVTLPTIWVGVLGGLAIASLGSLIWLTRLPPAPDCKKLSAFAADVDQLYCAEQAAQTGKVDDLLAGINLVKGWQTNHLLYAEAQTLLSQWSGSLLLLAQDQLAQGNFDQAVEMAGLVPEQSPVYADAQAKIKDWQAEWQQGKQLKSEIEAAVEQQQWPTAQEKLKKLLQLDEDYWVRQQGGELRQLIKREETAFNTLTAATELADSDDPDELAEAIALAQSIPVQARAWDEAKPKLDGWSRKLLRIGFKRWEEGDLDGAIAAVQKVPADPTLTREARDLIQISYAEKAASDEVQTWIPSFYQIYALQEAIAAVRTMSPLSPFYEEAQSHLQEWQAEQEDLIQLQYANLLAGFQQKFTYQIAIQQAQTLQTERPRRTQAQTLIAHWRQEIERIEDQPYLDRATALASVRAVPNLKAAIAEASKIELGRALRVEAQTYIADWQVEIEIIEDQPILDEAVELANQNKLTEAIEVARKIESGRALYDKAREQIGNWTAQIQIKEDRPILTRAENLAARGSLSAAIETASQIGAGRALYREAQSSIAIWKKEREAIWETWATEDAQTDDYAEDSYDSGYDDGYSDDYYDDGYAE